MKTITLIFFLLIISVSLTFANDLSGGLIAYYPFNGNANDFSGNDHHGTENNGITYVEGKSGQAVSFDGHNDNITIWTMDEINQYINTREGSVSVWFNVSQVPSGSSSFIFQYYGNSNDRLYLDATNTTSTSASLRLGIGDNHKLSTNKVNSGVWNHAIVTWTPDGKARLYINGLLDHEGTFGNPGFEFKGNEKFYFGRGWSGNTGYYNGALDDVRIYNRALTVSEIQQLSSSTAVCSEAHPELCDTASNCQYANANWCNNVCQSYSCPSTGGNLEVPAISQVFDYAPIAIPITGNEPKTSYPIGIGTAAENGTLLNLDVSINSFNGPVDFYLGLHATAIDPAEIYLFTEAGGLQGLNATGLVPWKQNQREAVTETVLSAIPTNLLPQGVYTFFMMVTPANSFTPSWLWSTAYLHSDVVKAVFVNTIAEDSWVMSAIDQNNLYYSFFGVKNNEGKLQHFNQLILDKPDSKGDFSPFLIMNFDQYGRPVTITKMDAGGQIFLDYISDSQISVSIVLDTGLTKKVVISNPYTDIVRRSAEFDYSVNAENSLLRNSSLDNNWLVGGNISACKDGKKPSVSVKRELPEAMLQAAPQLALIKPTIEAMSSQEQYDFTYNYRLQGLADYDSWYWSCAWNYSGGVVTGLAGSVVGIIDKIYQFGSAVISDVNSQTTDKTVNNVVDNIGDEILPIWSFLRKLHALGKLPIDSHNGPCSEKVYTYLNQIQTARQTVIATLNGVTRQASFTPSPEQLSQYLTVVDAPAFDFSDSCKTEDNSCTIPDDATKYENTYYGKYQIYYLSKDKHRVGPFVSFYDAEKALKYEQGCYDNLSQKQGTWEKWDSEGHPTSLMTYRDDALNGPYKSWFKGNIKEEGRYSNEKKDGLWINYFDSGIVSKKTNYKDGDKHGLLEDFHYPGGEPKSQSEHVNDQWNGHSTGWDTDGLITLQREGEMRVSDDGKLRFWGQYYTNAVNAPPTLCQIEADEFIHCEYVDAR